MRSTVKQQAMRPGAATSARVRPVVLCGGFGTRLWPWSQALSPKQLLPITNEQTMLQATIGRTQHHMFKEPILICGEEHLPLVRDQVHATSASLEAIIVEPDGRSTAAAIALAAYLAAFESADELMLVMPSDHVILDVGEFLESVAAGLPAAEDGALVAFGIEPTKPETAYGYIEAGGAVEGMPRVRKVCRFVEKPDMVTAEAFCGSGVHLWNAGIFLFRASTFLHELRSLAPQIDVHCQLAMELSSRRGLVIRPAPEPFLSCPALSVDCAVMQKTNRACVVPVAMQWSDVGSWDALWDISTKDQQLNAVHGDVVAVEAEGCLLRSEGDLALAVLGVKNLVVVAANDAVLVVPRDRAQDAKFLARKLEELRSRKRSLHPRGTA